MHSRSLGHRAPLLWLLLPFIAGLALGRAGDLDRPLPLLAPAAAAALAALLASRSHPRLWAAALIPSLLLAGMASQALGRARLPDWESLPPREARLSLRIDRLFAIKEPRRAAGLATVTHAEPHLRDLVGQRLYFTLDSGRAGAPPERGAEFAAIGVIATLPRHAPADTFDGYLANAGANFRLSRGRLLEEERPAGAYRRFCAQAARRFKEILGHGIREKRPELAALLRGMMLGETRELGDEQRELFMRSGTMHLFAISGMNIGVIAAALHALLALLRLPAILRFAIGSSLLWLFVDITGASPSAVRAFAMAVFLAGAFTLRRPAGALAALAASALVVLIVEPLQIFSASFLMSYVIVLALLLLGLPLGEAWLARWTPWRDLPAVTWTPWQRATDAAWRLSASALAIGLATTLVSLITGVQYFRLLTPGALVANLALIPAAMAATLGGFASLLCGLVGADSGASLCNHAAALTLLLIERLVRFGVELPGAFIGARFALPWIGPAALAALTAALLAGYAGGWRRAPGGWWPPFAVVALALAIGVKFG